MGYAEGGVPYIIACFSLISDWDGIGEELGYG
jgi:hypothetical protein